MLRYSPLLPRMIVMAVIALAVKEAVLAFSWTATNVGRIRTETRPLSFPPEIPPTLVSTSRASSLPQHLHSSPRTASNDENARDEPSHSGAATNRSNATGSIVNDGHLPQPPQRRWNILASWRPQSTHTGATIAEEKDAIDHRSTSFEQFPSSMNDVPLSTSRNATDTTATNVSAPTSADAAEAGATRFNSRKTHSNESLFSQSIAVFSHRRHNYRDGDRHTTSTAERPHSSEANEHPQAPTALNRASVPPRSIIEAWSSSRHTSIPHQRESLILANKLPGDVVTVADLQTVLLDNEFVRRADLRYDALSTHTAQERNGQPRQSASRDERPRNNGGRSSGGVAFPQPRVLLHHHIVWGTACSGTLLGLMVLSSVQPSLWLVGAMAGALLGYDTGRETVVQSADTEKESNVMREFLLASGRRLAILYLKILDAFQAFFFMYKTGQLSYTYYKRYAALDNRFAIQQKVDAWNARFVEGKLAFDKWERENEVGRKLLAGLRTVWLVEERNLKKRTGLWKRNLNRQSRYRIVQLVYDAMSTVRAMCWSLWKALRGGDEIRDFTRGMYFTAKDNLQERMRSVAMAVVTISCIGALFTRSPLLIVLVAASLGWMWPRWMSDSLEQMNDLLTETRARGQGSRTLSDPKRSRAGEALTRKTEGGIGSSRYHFFQTLDGSKRFYRVGQPWFAVFRRERMKEKKSIFAWPWRS
jgi:hypothetical protein